jgi:hypothetical protein
MAANKNFQNPFDFLKYHPIFAFLFSEYITTEKKIAR